MKKFLSRLLVLCLALVMCAGTVFATDGKVEISFCVGDETLLINGQEVTVEKPYVVGAGVTLVPLRVITEAFGATVEWIDSTQTINISYPDVEIVLQIGNPVAEVNKKAETLLSAPELTVSGYTMVPLRFISETFGAVVSYDEATERITVVKESTDGEQSLVVGGIDEANVGDSYFGWTMENPSLMTMTERQFDGTYTEFSYDDLNDLSVGITPIGEDYDFEKSFTEYKNSFKDYTLVKADKDTSDSKVKYMHFQAKNKEAVIDVWEYQTEKSLIVLVGAFELEKEDVMTEGLRVLESFKCSFVKDGTYDLSTVENGVRKFNSEEMKFSMAIPQDFYQIEYDTENDFEFYKFDDEDRSCTGMTIYSKSSVGSAKEMAEKDFTRNSRLNPEVVTFATEAVVEKTYANFKGYEYEYEVKTTAYNTRNKDIFFELGDYVYNVHVHMTLPDADADAKIDAIINSVKAEQLDASKIGTLLRNDADTEGTYVSKEGKWSMTVPNDFEELEVAADGALYESEECGVGMLMTVTSASDANFNAVQTVVKEYEKEMKSSDDTEIVKSNEVITLGDIKYATFTFRSTLETGDYYTRVLVGAKNGKVYMFTVSCPEIAYSEYAIQRVEDIIKTLKVN